ncbi:ubiquitin-related domain-containing protein [Syncephalis plumigaleata]|nr:ubiquitin-related domain-containing protein [Syncephalis plumigaleata]
MSDRASTVQDTITPTSTVVGGNDPHSVPSIFTKDDMIDHDHDDHEESTATTHSGQVALTCLLVNGERHTFHFTPEASIQLAKQHIHEHWPKEWTEPRPDDIDSLKLLYLGRFLDDENTLTDNSMAANRSYIVHLTIRRRVPSESGKLIYR